jgi:monofunctional biosynthetic peptidoglycan transglycosylase
MFTQATGVAQGSRRRSLVWRIVSLVAMALGGLVLVLGVWIAVLALRLPPVAGIPQEGAPPPSAYMRRSACGDRMVASYRPLAQLSPRLLCAVVVAEDRRFFQHEGVDWQAVRDAGRQALRERRIVSGAGTIAMQLARNWFLSGERSLSRKIQEGLLARQIVSAVGKPRVLELYLNLAEWGPCRYGAEAGARGLFGRGTETLDWFEATLLAVLLPRPTRDLLPSEGAALAARQRTILHYLGARGLLSPEELLDAMREVELGWARLAETSGVEGVARALRSRRGKPPDPRGPRWLDESCHL